jgi:hypothetical protein
MRFCEGCGQGHECEADTADGAEKAAVAIARIEANRDIEVARLNAGAAKVIAEAEAQGEAEHAEGVVEGLELATGGGEPDADDAAAPVIVVDGGDADEPDADDTAEEPPEVTAPAPEPGPRKPRSWDEAYR